MVSCLSLLGVENANMHQRDDEKYPSTVTYEQPGLELVPQAPLLPPKDRNGSVLFAELPGTQAGYQHYQPQQHTAQPAQQPQYAAYKPTAPATGYANSEALNDAPPTPGFLLDPNRNTGDFNRPLPPRDVSMKRYCGLPKRVFIAVIVLLVILLIAIIAGVAAAASHSKKSATSTPAQDGNSQNQGSASSTSSISQPSQTKTASDKPSATSSAPGSASSTPPVVRVNFDVQKSAVSFSGDGTTNTFLQTFSQNMGTGDINYRLYLSTKKAFQTPQRLALTVSALIGTPMTSTTQYDDTTFTTLVNFFYLTGNSTSTNLAMAIMTCSSTSPTCSTTSNDIVAQSIKYPIHPSSSLAATYLPNTAGWRIYYTNADSYISEMTYAPAASNEKWGSNIIGGKTSEGSSIAVLNQPPTGLNVYYMDDSARITSLTYKGGWSDPSNLNPAGPLNATIPLAAVYVPKVFTYQIFYLDTVGAMHSYAKINSTGTWQGQTSKSWAIADPETGISATAWNEQIRMYYFSKGKLNQGAVSKVPAVAKTAQTWANAVIT